MALTPALGKPGALERPKYAARKGRVKLLARELYASVPPGADPERFQPDRYLVAAAARPDAIFCYRAALELLGAAHSDWTRCAVFTARRRATLTLGRVSIDFVNPPPAFRHPRRRELGAVTIDRLGRILPVTGRERTLLDGLRRPGRTGGLASYWSRRRASACSTSTCSRRS
jgi:hypothetical protein